MLKQDEAEKILDYAMSHKGDYAEVFYEETSRNQITMFGEKISIMNSGTESGTGIRIFKNGTCSYFYSNAYDEKKILQMLKEQWRPDGASMAFNQRPLWDRRCYCGNKYQPASLKDKVKLLKRCNQAGFSYHEKIAQMSTGYTDMDQRVIIANTEGCWAEDRRQKTRLYINATARDGGDIKSSYTGPGAMGGFEYYEKIHPEEYALKAASSALSLLHAKPCPTGKMPVIIAHGFGGLFFHEACGHSLEASAVADGASEFAGRMGEKIANEKITLIDDGSIDGEWGSLCVDDEGIPAQKNILIENGILKGYLVDRWNGEKLLMKPTGSARRENYRFAPVSRMTNTYIAPGEDRFEDMVASVERGIYVKNINAGSVNTITGEFNFNANETFLIEHGKLTVPVHNATLIGRGSEVLQKVEMVGNDFELRQGFCYADSGAIYIGVGQPSVKVSEMTVGGDEVC